MKLERPERSDKRSPRNSKAQGNRVTETIAHEAAKFIALEAGSESLITVIRAERESRAQRVMVFVSVYPESKGQAAINFLERHRQDFSNYLKSHVRLGPLPRIDFMLDNREQGISEKT
jgi:ribosome-binding factor A